MSEPRVEPEAHARPGYGIFFIVWAVLVTFFSLLFSDVAFR